MNAHQTLIQLFRRLRDVSLRDGIQCWYGNKWQYEDIEPILRAFDHLAVLLKQEGGTLAPMEVWGGGQVAQPAKFLGEDPFYNLSQMHQSAPHLTLQVLLRGRQCLGFIPTSDEVQQQSILAIERHGVRICRVFDMMNDMTNLEKIFTQLKQSSMKTEGAICYISEPAPCDDDQHRVWTFADYAQYALVLAQQGCDEILIKDYAGLLFDVDETVFLIKQIKQQLANHGYDHLPLNLHSHNHKPEVLVAALNAGADKVDVALGALADGPSHTHIFAVIEHYMAQQGFAKTDYHQHPSLNHLRYIERLIARTAEKYQGIRSPEVAREETVRYRMAGGAMGDIWNRVLQYHRPLCEQAKKLGREFPISTEDFYHQILSYCQMFWELGGRFNTVTPGALILTNLIIQYTIQQIYGYPFTLEKFPKKYMEVVCGRYGYNRGMEEKNIGDAGLRDSFLLYNSLRLLNRWLRQGKIKLEQVQHLLLHGKIPVWINHQQIDLLELNHRYEHLMNDQVSAAITRAQFDTQTTHWLQLQLTPAMNTLRDIDLAHIKQVVMASNLPDELKQPLIFELTPGRAPTPVLGITVGEQLLQQWQIDVPFLVQQQKPVCSDTAALLVMILRSKENGVITDKTALNLFHYLAHGVTADGSHIEVERFDDIYARAAQELATYPQAKNKEAALKKILEKLSAGSEEFMDLNLPIFSRARIKRALRAYSLLNGNG